MYSSKSLKDSKFPEASLTHDIVLNVEDSKRGGKKLGKTVTLCEAKKSSARYFFIS